MNALYLSPSNFHETEVNGDRFFWHVSSGGMFRLDGVSSTLIDEYRSGHLTSEEACSRLAPKHSSAEVLTALEELQSLEILQQGAASAANSFPTKVESFPLSTLVLSVNTGCNLSCTYCYKEDLQTPTKGQKMEFPVAKKAIELLLEESPDRERYNIVFFGGEPLSHMPLIREVVEYCEQRITRQLGKIVDFSMTTNATMLTEKLVDYFQAHNFCLTVSMDGPQAIHDKNRITVSGQGTYAVVAEKSRMLLSRYRVRPVGARVTLTHGTTDVVGIWDHLYNDLGFSEVGFSPVTSGDIASYNLNDEELAEIFGSMKELGKKYVAAAVENRSIGFSNMHQLLTKIHEGTSNALPCGAGVSLLSVDNEGSLDLCHRFTGSKLPQFGNVFDGIEKESLASLLEQRLDRTETACSTCWIRNLCSGGCYHESYARYDDPAHPVYHYCDHMRDWIDFGTSVYLQILEKRPEYFGDHLEPRHSSADLFSTTA